MRNTYKCENNESKVSNQHKLWVLRSIFKQFMSKINNDIF